MRGMTVFERFVRKVQIEPCGCHIWTASKFKTGYGRLTVAGKSLLAHRLAWEMANGEIPAEMFVCHHCDRRACVNPEHLFLGSHEDNMADMVAKGRSLSGEGNPYARLNNATVKSIRESVGSQLEIAERFGVHQTTVSRVLNRRRWAA